MEVMALVGDRDRERAAVSLQRHYLDGRLTEDEFDARLDAALHARTRLDLLLAVRRLPGHSPLRELAEPTVRAVVQAASRVVLLAALASAWLVGTAALVVAFAVAELAGDVGTSGELGFLLALALLTWAVARAWRRSSPAR